MKEEYNSFIKFVVDSETKDLITNKFGQENKSSSPIEYSSIKPKINDLKIAFELFERGEIFRLTSIRTRELESALKSVKARIEEILHQEVKDQQSIEQQKRSINSYFDAKKIPVNIGSGEIRLSEFENDINIISSILTESIALKDEGAGENVDTLVNTLHGIVDDAEKSKKELGNVLDSAKLEIADSGVSIHAEIFANEASKHKGESEDWIKYIKFLFLSALVAILILLIIFICVESSKLWRIGLSGVVLISLISYAISICIKNFFAQKHLEQVNMHKSNCLSTFNTFVDSAKGNDERYNAILLQTTQTIFSHQKTGFLSRDNEQQSGSPIIELVRNVGKHGSE